MVAAVIIASVRILAYAISNLRQSSLRKLDLQWFDTLLLMSVDNITEQLDIKLSGSSRPK